MWPWAQVSENTFPMSGKLCVLLKSFFSISISWELIFRIAISLQIDEKSKNVTLSTGEWAHFSHVWQSLCLNRIIFLHFNLLEIDISNRNFSPTLRKVEKVTLSAGECAHFSRIWQTLCLIRIIFPISISWKLIFRIVISLKHDKKSKKWPWAQGEWAYFSH